MSGPLGHPLLSIVVPAYNEVQRIRQTLRDMQSYLDAKGYDYEIIVSADGTDGTREAVAEMALTDSRLSVIGSPERRGKGRGVREGMLRARGLYVGNVDADYKTPIDQLERMMPFLKQGYDVVIGSRRAEGTLIEKQQPLYRRMGSKGFAIVMRGLVGLYGINDTQCGFKFFSRRAAISLFSKQKLTATCSMSKSFDSPVSRECVSARLASAGQTTATPGTTPSAERSRTRKSSYASGLCGMMTPSIRRPPLNQHSPDRLPVPRSFTERLGRCVTRVSVTRWSGSGAITELP